MSEQGLSPQQADFLVWLLAAYRETEAPGRLTMFGRRQLTRWGVHIGRLPNGVSRAESASISRALRRLEARGLIERKNSVSGTPEQKVEYGYKGQHRTTNVRLTAEGWDLAERLTAANLSELTGGEDA